MLHPNTPAPASSDHSEEISATLGELIASFGHPAVAQVATECGILAQGDTSSQPLQQAIRRYTLLLIDRGHNALHIARIVGRLTYLDTANGVELTQEQIGREMGITKAAVSRIEADIAFKLGLPRRSSPQARESHRRMNRRNYSFIVATCAAA